MKFTGVFPKGWFAEESPKESDKLSEAHNEDQPAATINLGSSNKKLKVISKPTTEPNVAIELSDKPDPEYAKYVMEFLEKENLPQIEYLEFSQAVHELIDESGIPVDQAFRTIFVAFKASGLTFGKLVETNQYYAGKLSTLEQEFINESDAIVTQKAEQVRSGIADITSKNIKLEKEAGTIRKRLQAIEKEVGDNKTQLDSLNLEVDSAEQTESSRKVKMQTAIRHFLEVINDDLSNINLYLNKGGKQ